MDIGLQATNRIMEEVGNVIIGKEDTIRKVMTCILAKGHILIDDIPGVGKTTLAVAFSKSMALKQNRIQFTPDVMPSDVLGYNMYNKATQKFEYAQGAVMCNMLLADEINRTSSKTQSALLEAMEEQRITVDGTTYNLPKPFIVIATQNPVGSIGTHMLPESQLDRFAMKLTMGYPSIEDEINMLKDKHQNNSMDSVKAIVDDNGLLYMQNEVDKVYVHHNIYTYIAHIAKATREHKSIELGLSPRGSVALCRLAKANAYISQRNYVVPDDVRAVLMGASEHRIILSSKAKIKDITIENIMYEIVGQVQVNKEKQYAEK